MAEYRLDELARISGVSARNIRAYRERGLLDPPRRVGRSAFYDDYHLSQLRTINQLHRRGFNSAHIAEFFASMRQGVDLADILGIQRAVLGPRPESTAEAPDQSAQSATPPPTPHGIDIDPHGDEARQLIDYGLAELADGAVVLTDPVVGEVIARTTDQLLYVRALLHIYEATRDAIDGLADGFVAVLEECLAAKFGEDLGEGGEVGEVGEGGEDYLPKAPKPGETAELRQIVGDYRELWSRVVSKRLDNSVQQQMAAAESAGILLGDQRPPRPK